MPVWAGEAFWGLDLEGLDLCDGLHCFSAGLYNKLDFVGSRSFGGDKSRRTSPVQYTSLYKLHFCVTISDSFYLI